jgi:hypothetical protein
VVDPDIPQRPRETTVSDGAAERTVAGDAVFQQVALQTFALEAFIFWSQPAVRQWHFAKDCIEHSHL